MIDSLYYSGLNISGRCENSFCGLQKAIATNIVIHNEGVEPSHYILANDKGHFFDCSMYWFAPIGVKST